MVRRHPTDHSHPSLISPKSALSSQFESSISLMVDPRQSPRRRKRTQFFWTAYTRCMSTRVGVVRRAATLILLVLGGALFMSGQTSWNNIEVNKPSIVSQNERGNELLEALYELDLPTSREELDALNEELASLKPSFILQWTHHVIFSKQKLRHSQHHPLVQVTSFGPTGLVIMHLMSKLDLLKDVPIITLDTLHLFKESYAFYDTVQRHPDFNAMMQLTITKPMNEEHEFTSREKFNDEYNSLWKSDPKRYTQLTKTNPLERVLREWEVQMWITGRRRSQGNERSNMQILEFEYSEDTNMNLRGDTFEYSRGRWKLNPLAFWTYDQVWSYIREQNVPYNPLYDAGYTSLGDEMTTRLPDTALNNDASFERSGRFVGLNQTECGLHLHRAKIKAKKKEAVAAGEELKVPTLSCDKCIDLDIDNFEEFLNNGEGDIILEFFSPFCGSCQEFAPTMERLSEYLSSNSSPMKVARFDITEHDVPLVNNAKLFEFEATPTLYRVKRFPLKVTVYEGEHDYHAILIWLGVS